MWSRSTPTSLSWQRLLLTFCFILAMGTLIATVSTMAEDAKTVKVTEKANGTSVKLQLGETLEILLPASIATGYNWTVSSMPNEILKPLSHEIKPGTDEGNKVGGTEQQIFRFQTVARGSARLELQYTRPWEKDSAQAKKYFLLLQVQ